MNKDQDIGWFGRSIVIDIPRNMRRLQKGRNNNEKIYNWDDIVPKCDHVNKFFQIFEDETKQKKIVDKNDFFSLK